MQHAKNCKSCDNWSRAKKGNIKVDIKPDRELYFRKCLAPQITGKTFTRKRSDVKVLAAGSVLKHPLLTHAKFRCCFWVAKTLSLVFAMFLFFGGVAEALDITLSWDANTEDDLGGYIIYYKTDTEPGPPYDGTGAVEGDSPIIISLDMDEDPSPERVQYTLHGLPDSMLTVTLRKRFAVTAESIFNLESGFSNEISVGVPINPGNLGGTPPPSP